MIFDYVSIDLETTGLNPKEDTILEIGVVKVRDKQTVETFHTLLNPQREISRKVMDLTGISNDDIKGMPTFKEIQYDLLNFIQEDTLLGHHIIFDYSFLKKAFVNNGAVSNKGIDTFEKKGIDTLKMARQKITQIESRSLISLCEYYQIELDAHRALNDARATSSLYLKMADQFYNENDDCSYPLKYKVKKEAPLTIAQKERLYKLLEKHRLQPKYDIESLTKNEASRYLDRILAAYGR